jgi:hypothetical protein
MLWRQGDLYIETVSTIPPGAVRLPHVVLAEGELTGHRHRIADVESAVVYEHRGQMFVEVVSDRADLVHDEHATINLDRGTYRVWRQREFDPVPRGFGLGSFERLVCD